MPKLISLIVPLYNEEKNIPVFFEKAVSVMATVPYDWELLLVNDGSRDNSLQAMTALAEKDPRVRVIDFSRNFGKEIAVTAGINHCKGAACITVDGDLQHPLELIPEFIKKWEAGAEVVVGVRKKNHGEGFFKKIGSYFFYKIINSISEMKIVTGSTDYRLLDRAVIEEFNRLSERNRMTRALIDWLGFHREYIHFQANQRVHGQAGYSFWKLVRLAFNSMISLSIFPLRLAGYLGIFITLLSAMLGLFMFITNYITGSLDFTGPAILAVIILFLIGIVLICLGFIALYIASIHGEVINRPLYIIRAAKKNFHD